MSTARHHPSLAEEQSGFPAIHLTHECFPQERSREAATPFMRLRAVSPIQQDRRTSPSESPVNIPTAMLLQERFLLPGTRQEQRPMSNSSKENNSKCASLNTGAPTRRLSTLRRVKRSPNSTRGESPPRSNGSMCHLILMGAGIQIRSQECWKSMF